MRCSEYRAREGRLVGRREAYMRPRKDAKDAKDAKANGGCWRAGLRASLRASERASMRVYHFDHLVMHLNANHGTGEDDDRNDKRIEVRRVFAVGCLEELTASRVCARQAGRQPGSQRAEEQAARERVSE